MRESEGAIDPSETEIGQPENNHPGYIFELEASGASPIATAVIARDACAKIGDVHGTTVEEFALLRTFNDMARSKLEESDFDVSSVAEEVSKIRELEKRNEENGLIPTIGFELESPETGSGRIIEGVFRNLFLKISRESLHSNKGSELLEFSSKPSFSSRTQAHIVQELLKIGFVPLDRSDNPNQSVNTENISGSEISRNEALSFHVNLGLGDMDHVETNSSNTWIKHNKLSVAIALAYSSSDRIVERKTNSAHKLKPGFTTTRGELNPYRYEIRATELRDSRIYRVLAEAQNIGALLKADIALSRGSELSRGQAELVFVYENLMDQIQGVFDRYGFDHLSFDRGDRSEVVRMMEDTQVCEEIRQVISRNAREARRILDNARS